MPQTIAGIVYELTNGATADIDDVWLDWTEWPPDVFAFLWMVLKESGLYRLVVSPLEKHEWPLDQEWRERVHRLPGRWLDWVDSLAASDDEKALPHESWARWRTWMNTLFKTLETTPLDRFEDHLPWRDCCLILEAHAIADGACTGLGIPEETPWPSFALTANHRLRTRGTLARHPTDVIRVLPKLRTAQVGLTLRSMSHHVACTTDRVSVEWRMSPQSPELRRAHRLSLLLVPWPNTVRDQFLRPVAGPLKNLDSTRFGFFDYVPAYKFDERYFVNLAQEARSRVDGPLGMVLPEAALTKEEALKLHKALDVEMTFFLTGIRGDRTNAALLLVPGERFAYEQPKHHRWCVDGSQIAQYGLEWSLNPARLWWENIEIGPRRLHFVCAAEWLSMCHLICEDLARLEPVSGLVRAIGPNLLIALLADGPQLERRWPGRYASVFSDDPGASVLTLSSLGMVQACGKGVHEPSRVIALWKDASRGARELELPPGASALLITLCAEYVTEWTADGRHDGGAAARLILVGEPQGL